MTMTSPAKLCEVTHIILQIWSCDQSLVTLLLLWSEYTHNFIGFASSSFMLISVNSKVFWCGYKINDTSLFFTSIYYRFKVLA